MTQSWPTGADYKIALPLANGEMPATYRAAVALNQAADELRADTSKDPRGTHTGPDGRQVPNQPGPLAEEYKRQTGRY